MGARRSWLWKTTGATATGHHVQEGAGKPWCLRWKGHFGKASRGADREGTVRELVTTISVTAFHPHYSAVTITNAKLKMRTALKDTHTSMFIAALFTITKTRKQPKCPTTKEWIKMWYTHTMEDQSAIKKEWNNAICGDMDGPTGSLRWFSGKESTCQCRRCRFHPWVRKIPWRKKWQPTPGFLPGKSHGQRSLVGYSLRGRKESDKTEQLTTHTGTDPEIVILRSKTEKEKYL